MSEFETVIGLEVHLQLSTETKIFCGCANLFGREPNTLTCPVCLGLPGSLPVLNKKALMYAIKAALALKCQINSTIKFDRKNYYYPDLPKGYQISQHDLPIAHDGWVMILSGGSFKKINIKRAHLEEDAGKLIHDTSLNCSLVDYNRTGTPLMEIVTEPDLRSVQEAYDYLTTLKLILQYLNVSDCDMEKGSLRCDANISIRKKGDLRLGTKTELKNMNSFRALKLALEFEETRHQKLLSCGQKIIQETRLWNDEKALTISMRSKEDAHDYRYFPEPDLVPFIIDDAELQEIKSSIPELPREKFERFLNNYKLLEYDAQILIQDQDLADFFEKCCRNYSPSRSFPNALVGNPDEVMTGPPTKTFGGDNFEISSKFLPETKKICNWLIGPIQQELNSRGVKINSLQIQPQELCDLIKKIEDGVLSHLAAKDVLKIKLDTGKTIDAIIRERGLTQICDDGTLENFIEEILAENIQVVDQIKQGKESAMGFLVGQAMKKTQGKANPKKIKELIIRRFHNG